MNDFSDVTLAQVKRLTVHPDLRGTVRETYRESWFPTVRPIKQLVRSQSKPKTLRGMHLHRRQHDVWHFVDGEALVRLYSHDLGRQEFIAADDKMVIAIPPGISHGFYTEKGCVLMYALTEEYTGDDEYGWYPFDGNPLSIDEFYSTADLRFVWPQHHAGLILSERDLRAPRLEDFGK